MTQETNATIRSKVTILLLTTLSLFLSDVFRCSAQDVNTISDSIVYLNHTSVETYSDKTNTYEIWLKQPGTNGFKPKLRENGGTGFLVGHGQSLYLVSVKHVASIMGFTDNDMVVVGGESNRAVALPLALLRGPDTTGWINHPTEDISILPLMTPVPVLNRFFNNHFMDMG